jgi:hypothetical protein
VRDSLGLTYDVSFAVNMFDMIRAGWFSVQVRAAAAAAVHACVACYQVRGPC